MKLTVLGGAGAWPPALGACSGYLIEDDGFRLLIDPGYGTLPRLLEIVPAESIDAVLISHGHPDHVADLNPLLRARAMSDDPPPRLPAYALPDALRPVLALDQVRSLADACEVREFEAGKAFPIGPFGIESRSLPHFVPNAGFRITANGVSVTYTGDAGPSDDLVELAGSTNLLLAEATYVEFRSGSLGGEPQLRVGGRPAGQAGGRRAVGADPSLAGNRSRGLTRGGQPGVS